MKFEKVDYAVWIVIIVAFGLFGYKAFTEIPTVQAQVVPTTLTIHAISDHTHCSLAQTPQLDGRGPGMCIATDGTWIQTSTDVTPWQLVKPSSGLATFTVNSKTADAKGNIQLQLSDIPGILQASQDMASRTCPVTSFTVGTSDTIKLGSCGN